MPALIFFGAGASAPFGLPTMTEMVDKFEKHLKDQNLPERSFYEQIKNELLRGYDSSQVDIESMFSVISGIASEINPKKMGPFPYYYIKRFATEHFFSTQEKENAKKLNLQLEEFVKKECRFTRTEEELLKIYQESYEPFFSDLFGVSYDKAKKADFPIPLGWKAYTTNYDIIFENFWNELFPIVDFFDSTNSNLPIFNRRKNLKNEWQTFVKLHGSIDWEKLEDNKIIKTSSTTFTRAKKRGAAMLYPIQQKDLYLNPWMALFDEFKEGLLKCDHWYFVGYGFNDLFIFEIIKEALTNEKRLIIINPHAKKIKEKFPKEFHDKIMLLPIKFCGKYFKKDFEDFAKNRRTIEVEIEITATHFGLDFPLRMEDTVNKTPGFGHQLTVTYHDDNRCRIEMYSSNNATKKFTFETQISGFIDVNDYFEIETQLEDPVPIHLTIKNQGRIIHVSTLSSHQQDNYDGKYKSITKIYYDRFFP